MGTPSPATEDRGPGDGGRILYFLPDGFPTFRPDITSLFGKFLPEQGIASDIVTHRTSPEPSEWPAGRVFAPPFTASAAKRKLTTFLGDLRTLFGCDARAYLALQVRDKPFLAPFVLGWARIRRRPAFYWMSFPISESLVRAAQDNRGSIGKGRYAFMMVSGMLGQAILYRLLPRFDHVFVQSDRMLEDMVARGIPRALMTPVPMCIDPDRFAEAPAPAETREGFQICYLGTCDRIRRIDFLFEAVALARASVPGIRLLIVGDAPEEADRIWLRARAKECGVDDITTITGWLPAEQGQAMVERADLCLALMAPDPILDSTTPTKLVEYLALGKPVVANDHPDQKAVLTGSGAGLCTPFDPAPYAEAIVTIAGDTKERARMGEAGRAYVFAHRNYREMGRKLAEVYRSLCRPTG